MSRVRAVDPRRAERARERQLDYMRSFREQWRGREEQLHAIMQDQARGVRARLTAIRPIGADDRVLEVGSGGCGIIFNFGGTDLTGVDPLADHLRPLFPWQPKSGARTIAAEGEHLPFGDKSFDILLSDNVIDHARDPQRIVEEMVRVMKPGGALYFTVHVHHPVYHWSSVAYGLWRRAGLPGEITPFADHTVHLTVDAGKRLFRGLPLRIVHETVDVAGAREQAQAEPPRHLGDRLKRLFFKNATLEIIAIRTE